MVQLPKGLGRLPKLRSARLDRKRPAAAASGPGFESGEAMSDRPIRHTASRLLPLAILMLLACLPEPPWAGEGEWIELGALKEKSQAPNPAAAESAAIAEAEPGAAPESEPRQAAGYIDLSGAPDSRAEELAAAARAARRGDRPQMVLPRRFHWQGSVRELGPVGYVYLGDYYVIEEHDYQMAELAWDEAHENWPDCWPVNLRRDLLQVMTGDWLRCAETMQVGFDEGLPPEVHQEYGMKPDSPILSKRMSDVPPVPAILMLKVLAQLKQMEVGPELAAPKQFLLGRLLAHVGDYDAALAALANLAMDEAAEPWNFQAASQRACLHLQLYQPELAYVNLLQAQALVGDHPILIERIRKLRDELSLQAAVSTGMSREEYVRIVAKCDGRWGLSRPESEFEGRVDVAAVGDVALGKPAAAGETVAPRGNLLYRGEAYWLMSLPLGADDPGWRTGERVKLAGRIGTE